MSRSPRWCRMALMISSSSMKLMIRMPPRHFGQTSGSISEIFWISLAQLFRHNAGDLSDSMMQGMMSATFFFCRFPHKTLQYQP